MAPRKKKRYERNCSLDVVASVTNDDSVNNDDAGKVEESRPICDISTTTTAGQESITNECSIADESTCNDRDLTNAADTPRNDVVAQNVVAAVLNLVRAEQDKVVIDVERLKHVERVNHDEVMDVEHEERTGITASDETVERTITQDTKMPAKETPDIIVIDDEDNEIDCDTSVREVTTTDTSSSSSNETTTLQQQQHSPNRPSRACNAKNVIDSSTYTGERVIFDVNNWETIAMSPKHDPVNDRTIKTRFRTRAKTTESENNTSKTAQKKRYQTETSDDTKKRNGRKIASIGDHNNDDHDTEWHHKKPKTTTTPTEQLQQESNSNATDGKLIVYSNTHRLLYGEGNEDFRLMIRAFLYEYLAEGVTKEIKASILGYIYNYYKFYAMDKTRAYSKIVKAVSDGRHLDLTKLKDDMDLRIKYTSPWVQQHLNIRDPLKDYYPNVTYEKKYSGSKVDNRSKVEGKVASKTEVDEVVPDVVVEDNRLKSPHLHEFDQSPFYIEELAYHYYYDQEMKMDRGTDDKEENQVPIYLSPLPPPPPIPKPPVLSDSSISNSVSWTYDPTTRIYLGDFTNVTEIPMIHKQFIGTLMERDDITVICEGLYDKQINVKPFLFELAHNFGSIPYSKFRQFNRYKRSDDEVQSYRQDLQRATNIATMSPDDNDNMDFQNMYYYEEIDGYRTLNVTTQYLPYLATSVYGAQDVKSCTFTTEVKELQEQQQQSKTNQQQKSTENLINCDLEESEENSDELQYNGIEFDVRELKDIDLESCIYMTDVELSTHCPRFDYEYKQQFKMKEILPGGAWCLMNNLPEQSRPFMGPNLYISPGGGYTQFHQDGHGTVDSGHSCLTGYNEVVMLRRLPECHKRQACQLIPSVKVNAGSTKEANSNSRTGRSARNADANFLQKQAENVLYRLPHDDFREDKLTWAQVDTIEQWEKLGYCPSVFILKPGQHLLINKGRLHAFRKMTFDVLPKSDCHARLRSALVDELRSRNIHRPPLCISVAFDWSFSGITADGINRELATTLDSALHCRKYSTCKSLAIPETAVLLIANSLPKRVKHTSTLLATTLGLNRSQYLVSWWEIARGILPVLRYITKRDCNVRVTRSDKIKHNDLPDTHPDAIQQQSTDPYGNDYFCKICSCELANSYFHCHGCEILLNKDFDICVECYKDKAYETNVEMNQWKQSLMVSHFHHVGKPKRQCVNKESHLMSCSECNKCLYCNCTCHTVFQKRARFFSTERQQQIVDHCGSLVQGYELKYSLETECQLNREPMISEYKKSCPLPPEAKPENSSYCLEYGTNTDTTVHQESKTAVVVDATHLLEADETDRLNVVRTSIAPNSSATTNEGETTVARVSRLKNNDHNGNSAILKDDSCEIRRRKHHRRRILDDDECTNGKEWNSIVNVTSTAITEVTSVAPSIHRHRNIPNHVPYKPLAVTRGSSELIDCEYDAV